jgi:hypothetical protein
MVPEEEKEGGEAAPAELSLTEVYKLNLNLAAEAYLAGLDPDQYFDESGVAANVRDGYMTIEECAHSYEGVSKSALQR